MFGLRSKDEKPASMPILHRLLRLAAASLVIGAVAKPLLNPEQPIGSGDGPILLVVDNDWSAARHWPARLEAMRNVLNHAGQRPVLILKTAAPQDGGNIRLSEALSADAAKQAIEKAIRLAQFCQLGGKSAQVHVRGNDGQAWRTIWHSDGNAPRFP